MTDKIHLTDEQWEFLKREEEKRTQEIKRHNEIVQSALLDAVSLMSKSDGVVDKRDYFAIHADWEDVRHYSTDGKGHNMSRVGARYKYADAMIKERDS